MSLHFNSTSKAISEKLFRNEKQIISHIFSSSSQTVTLFCFNIKVSVNCNRKEEANEVSLEVVTLERQTRSSGLEKKKYLWTENTAKPKYIQLQES